MTVALTAAQQRSVDQFNTDSPTTKDILDTEADQVLAGLKTSKVNRADQQQTTCPDVVAGYTPPTPGNKALCVTISPNSPSQSSQTASQPNQVLVAATGAQVLAPNANRLEVLIQNVGTSAVMLVLGAINFPVLTGTRYHVVLFGGTSPDDGTGASWISDLWKGGIFAICPAGNGILAITELTQ